MHNDRDLLPGVVPPSRAAFDASAVRKSVEQARQRAAVEDLLDFVVLIVVNLTFLLWPNAHIPVVGRDGTTLVLLLANAAAVWGYTKTRILPRIQARRIAGSWSADERARFRARARA